MLLILILFLEVDAVTVFLDEVPTNRMQTRFAAVREVHTLALAVFRRSDAETFVRLPDVKAVGLEFLHYFLELLACHVRDYLSSYLV